MSHLDDIEAMSHLDDIEEAFKISEDLVFDVNEKHTKQENAEGMEYDTLFETMAELQLVTERQATDVLNMRAKAAEFLLEMVTEFGPDMDLETYNLIVSCKSCEKYYNEVVGRMDDLERRFQIHASTLEDSDHKEDLQSQPRESNVKEDESDVPNNETDQKKDTQHSPECGWEQKIFEQQEEAAVKLEETNEEQLEVIPEVNDIGTSEENSQSKERTLSAYGQKLQVDVNMNPQVLEPTDEKEELDMEINVD